MKEVNQMKKTLKYLVPAILALVCMFALTQAAFAADEIKEGKIKISEFEKEYEFYFTPAESGKYRFAVEDYQHYGALKISDESWNTIADYDMAQNKGRRYVPLEAGKKYRIVWCWTGVVYNPHVQTEEEAKAGGTYFTMVNVDTLVGKTFTSSGKTYKVTKASYTPGADGTSTNEVFNVKITSAKTASSITKDYVINKGIQYSVTAIGANACEGNKNLTKVKLTEASIGKKAFAKCTNLKTVSLENVTKVGPYAFTGCKNLRAISMRSYKIMQKANWKDSLRGSSVSKVKLTLLHDTGSSNTMNGYTSKMKKILASVKTVTAKSNSGKTVTVVTMN